MPPRFSRYSDMNRRSFLRGAGLGLLSFSLAGAQVLLTPRQARARGADFKSLGAVEVKTLEALGEVLVPGARTPILSISNCRPIPTKACSWPSI